jgi:hypothetical protein
MLSFFSGFVMSAGFGLFAQIILEQECFGVRRVRSERGVGCPNRRRSDHPVPLPG